MALLRKSGSSLKIMRFILIFKVFSCLSTNCTCCQTFVWSTRRGVLRCCFRPPFLHYFFVKMDVPPEFDATEVIEIEDSDSEELELVSVKEDPMNIAVFLTRRLRVLR